jgi:hypothetical protein
MTGPETVAPHLIVSLEEAALNGLPALRTQYYDGWILRFADGYSRRANSVTPLYHSTMPLERKLAHCESIFEAAALPCIFKMTNASQPQDLDRHLKLAGFERDADTVVQTRMIDAGFSMPSEVELREDRPIFGSRPGSGSLPAASTAPFSAHSCGAHRHRVFMRWRERTGKRSGVLERSARATFLDSSICWSRQSTGARVWAPNLWRRA